MKLLLGLFALMLAVGFATLWLWRRGRSTDPSPCETRELSWSEAPGGRARADVFEVHCPGAVTTHVALRQPDRPVEARSDVFVGLGSVPVDVRWNGEREVRIESDARRLLVEETRWREIKVRVQRR